MSLSQQIKNLITYFKGNRKYFEAGAIAVIASICITFIVNDFISQSFSKLSYKEGDVIRSSIISNDNYLVEDKKLANQVNNKQLQDPNSVIYHKINRGEVIARSGDKVTPLVKLKIDFLKSEIEQSTSYASLVGSVVLSFFVLSLLYVIYYKLFAEVVENKDLIFIALMLCAMFCMVKIFMLLGRGGSLGLGEVHHFTAIHAAPLAVGGMVICATLGLKLSLYYALSFTILVGLLIEPSWLLILQIFFGNIVSSILITHSSRRSGFIYSGMWVSVLNACLVTCYWLTNPDYEVFTYWTITIYSIISGLSSGIFAMGVTPIAEYLGGYITDVNLLELGSIDRPLLRELSLQAPGTWNHSVIVSQLSEMAAKKIGANSILLRVGAYYHDIGKTKKPLFYTENQVGTDNKHDKLTPSMSALVIQSHVKDGSDMAKKANLPHAIIDLIEQHHGTSRIEYFYKKASQQAGDGNIDESQYRYPGPKPQTKEAGILMLADVIEASSKSLKDPTPAQINTLVKKAINKIFSSGELDETDLTLKDLNSIAETFNRVLNSIYHKRIQYDPEPKESNKSEDANKSVKKQSRKSEEHDTEDSEDSIEVVKKLKSKKSGS